MQSVVFKYIEFLLPTHNCVIIPEFGGFIVNLEPSRIMPDDRIVPPAYRIVFNPDLKHNDGLLASLIHKDENISYNAACLKIKNIVNDIKRQLQQKEIIGCNNIGKLYLDENDNIVFKSNELLIHPFLFGLSQVKLSKLSQIDEYTPNKERRSVSLKYTFGTIAAASAALLLLITPSVKIGDNNSHQQAGFISTLADVLPSSQSNIIESFTDSKMGGNENVPEDHIAVADAVSKPLRMYYIIVGGEDTSTRANILLCKIHADNFPNAGIIESDRYRIYVASFIDKNEAETFLDKFREENPKYKTAWLFSKRNK